MQRWSPKTVFCILQLFSSSPLVSAREFVLSSSSQASDSWEKQLNVGQNEHQRKASETHTEDHNRAFICNKIDTVVGNQSQKIVMTHIMTVAGTNFYGLFMNAFSFIVIICVLITCSQFIFPFSGN